MLEIILIIFAIRTLLQSRTRADNSGKHFITFDEKVLLSPYMVYFLSDDALFRKLTNWSTNGFQSHSLLLSRSENRLN